VQQHAWHFFTRSDLASLRGGGTGLQSIARSFDTWRGETLGHFLVIGQLGRGATDHYFRDLSDRRMRLAPVGIGGAAIGKPLERFGHGQVPVPRVKITAVLVPGAVPRITLTAATSLLTVIVRDTPGATGKLAATVAATISVVLRPTFT
jgi:hypothetical protein